ncbi:YeeE/YedE family protein [Parasphingopyxis algicola]|uniref:YeeE/YedE family protein n=1 Tax=Parasphingopyxis algicola TaxID=2026624 RepID=UPI0015A3134B|nr:YeeE/YedE thiosulfate transporter family protein [Parasphingopyxis algicola]QLC24810.1 YeeE/YedE family protein [Parasphingopyxis algicola]
MIPDYAMPVQGLIGGLMIGVAAAVMLLGLGRIAGVSGLLARMMRISDSGPPLVLAGMFTVGLPLGAFIVSLLSGPVETRYPESAVILIVGGLVVGFGTRLGSGCTSGHGVCGLSRLSKRSVVATLCFMGAGFATVAIMNGLGLGW